MSPAPEYLEIHPSFLMANSASTKYGQSPRWEEMDRFWAGEHAARALGQSGLLGRNHDYMTFSRLLEEQILETELKKGSPIKSIAGLNLAEIGSGSAQWSLRNAVHGAEVSVFDKSWNGLGYALYCADLLGAEVRGRFHEKQGDFYSTGYPNNFFKAVYGAGVVEHLSPEDQDNYIRELFRILEPLGLIALTVPNHESPIRMASQRKEKSFFEWVKKNFPTMVYLSGLPMAYHEKGGARDLGEILKKGGFNVVETEAVNVALPVPLPRDIVDKNPVARRFYGAIEKMSKGGLRFDGPDSNDSRAGKMEFWDRMENSLSKDERGQIAWWRYIVGRKIST
ncbi:class I SAM-dependent methyltransferase [Candidatus Woesearchaeota archaeon]|nr:class I SAM-dependent methyltransferase [Candidatus Woesearchaeota archaeon]